MLEPPDLSDESIIEALDASFGIRVAAVVFLPIGDDPDSWAYRVEQAGGPAYFLKVRTRAAHGPGTAVPYYLHKQGVPHVLAPLPTATDAPYIHVTRFALTLYPMIDGGNGADVGLSPDHLRELGAVMKQIHTLPVTEDLVRIVKRESFRPSRRELFDDLQARLRASDLDPVARELSAFWRARQEVIHSVVDQADAMGRELGRLSFHYVLCHADLHAWNLLIDPEERLWIVDWDEAIVAPKERDLMFVVGGIGTSLEPRDTEWFLQGYGEVTIDQRLLAYYRYAWAVQDVCAYGEDVFLSPTLRNETRRASLHGFKNLFEPGSIVEIATTTPPLP